MIEYKKPAVYTAFRRTNLIKAQFKEMTMMNDTSMHLRALMMGGKTYIIGLTEEEFELLEEKELDKLIEIAESRF